MMSPRVSPQTLAVTAVLPQREAPSSFRDMFESEYAYVRTSARRLGIRERELDDLVHDVFLAVHRKLGDFEPGRPVRPWLFGITFRVVLGQKRRFAYSREQLSQAEPVDAADDQPPADERLETEERRRMVHEALAALDDEKRAVFILHELDEIPMADLARALDVPTNTAYSRLRLARQEFRRVLERLVLRASKGRGAAS